jgi:exopolysaccharide biosynthesis polyprenyl glycosylphosphotransferase
MNTTGHISSELLKAAAPAVEAPGARERRRAPDSPRAAESGRKSRLHWGELQAVLLDLLCVGLSSVLANQLRLVLLRSSVSILSVPAEERADIAFFLLYAILLLLLCQSVGLYHGTSRLSDAELAGRVMKAVLLATTLLIALVYFSGVRTVSRLIVLFVGILNWLLMTLWRDIQRRRAERSTGAGIRARNVLIVGAGRVGRELARQFDSNPHWGYRVKGFVDQLSDGSSKILGSLDDIETVMRSHFIEDVVITIPSRRNLVKSVAIEARKLRCNLKVVPDLYDGLGWFAPVEYLGKFPVMELYGEPIPTLGLLAKRVIDVSISALALILFAPVMAAVALAIRIDSRGGIFYPSRRVGRKGRKFICFKFRTMIADADKHKAQLRSHNERRGPFFKMQDDPRITRIGRILRKYSLDELPQFWNVFRGDMSLVGPRPHPTDDFEHYLLEHYRRLDVKPGVTGLWQVTARRDPSFETNMALDLQYIENWNLWLDLEILWQTLPAVLRAEGC